MELKWIATAAFAAALIPAAAAAQAKTSADSNASRSSTSRDTVTSTSTGDVSSSRSQASSVTPEMLKGQQDPNIIGSPAWWKSHATADGKPISGPPKD
jgi:hypothetical protein